MKFISQYKCKAVTMYLAATRKKAQLVATGGGPPPEELSTAESLALSCNKGPKIDGILGGVLPLLWTQRSGPHLLTVLSTTVPPLHGVPQLI